jgi:hypothetical protein
MILLAHQPKSLPYVPASLAQIGKQMLISLLLQICGIWLRSSGLSVVLPPICAKRLRQRPHSASTGSTADSPAAALIEALDSEVLVQVTGAYGGLGGLRMSNFRDFHWSNKVLPKLVQITFIYIE